MTDPEPAQTQSDARRLEQLWTGDFGDDYVDRNAGEFSHRQAFWANLLPPLGCERVLEVGCNLGGNLQWVRELLPEHAIYGVDVNLAALSRLRGRFPGVNAVWSPARELPFRDGWFDFTFTMGVLIHQPDSTLPLVMGEMVRSSKRWILCGEYFADERVAVPYHGQEAALFKRDYGKLFRELFPELQLAGQGFLGRNEGWDDVTWWLFDKRQGSL